MANTIDFTNKDYEAFRSMMIEALKERLPEYTDTTQTDAGIVIIELLAKGLDVLSYYQDVYANETYLSTCELMSSALMWCNLLGYVPRQATPARCKQIFKKSVAEGDLTIPKGTQVKTSDNIIFETAKDLLIPDGSLGDEKDESGNYLHSVEVVQGYTIGSYDSDGNPEAVEFVATGDGTENQTYTLKYAPAMIEGVTLDDKTIFGELEVYVGGNVKKKWTRVDSFISSGPNDEHYRATINEYDQIVLTFGSTLLGKIPSNEDSIYVSYRVGGGTQGNVVVNSITGIVSNIDYVVSTTNVTAPENEYLGADKENLESIKVNVPAHFSTLNRAVTLQDHTDLIMLNKDYAGIIKSAITHGKLETASDPNYKDTVQIYLQAYNGMTITNELISKVKSFITSKQIIGTFAEVLPATPQNLKVKGVLAVKEGYVPTVVESDIRNKVYEYLSNSAFNVEQEFDIVKFESLVYEVNGVKYFRLTEVNGNAISPESLDLSIAPNRGCYFDINEEDSTSIVLVTSAG